MIDRLMEVRFDGHCFGCGPLNEEGLQLKFVPGPEGSVAELVVPERFQSWSGMAHGGVVAVVREGGGGRAGGCAAEWAGGRSMKERVRRARNVRAPVREAANV